MRRSPHAQGGELRIVSWRLEIQLGRVRHAIEKQGVRGRGRGHFAVVARREETRNIVERPAAARDVEHRPYEKSDHVMQEAVGFDLEHQPTRAFAPSRFHHATAMIVLGRRRTEYSEAPEAVVTLEVSGRGIQSAPRQGLPESQLVPTTKWRVCFVIRADVVTITPAHSTVPRVKLVSHLCRPSDPDVRRQHGIERAPELLNVSSPSFGYSHSDRLSARMHSRVGATRSQRAHRCRAQTGQCLFENTLYCALPWLALPPAESGAVVVQHELHSALGH